MSFVIERRPLRYAETMLLVDRHHGKAFKFYPFIQQGMGPKKNGDFPFF